MTNGCQSGTPSNCVNHSEKIQLTQDQFKGDLQTISIECPSCKTDTALSDVVEEGTCAGQLYDLADCTVDLSLVLFVEERAE